MLFKDKEIFIIFDKRGNELIFLLIVFNLLEYLLLDKGDRPYFTPFLIILFGIGSTYGNFSRFNLHNDFFQSN